MEEQAQEQTQTEAKSSKPLYIAIGVILLCFAVLFAIRFIRSPTAEVITIDELHEKNIKGEISDINYVYNGFSFVFADGLWYTQVQKKDTIWDVPLHFGPKHVGNISIIGKLNNNFGYNNDTVYITFDPTGEDLQYIALASAELSLSLTKGFGITPIAACSENKTEVCSQRPIKTCEDKEDIIYIRQANEAKVELNGNCIVIQGDDWEIVKSADRLLLKWYKIIS